MSDRKCDKCSMPATRGRIIRKDEGGQRVPDYAEFGCVLHQPQGGVPWGSVAHAADWEDSDAPDVNGCREWKETCPTCGGTGKVSGDGSGAK